MVEIPESLLRRSAEAKAKALGVPVEQVLAEMKGEGPPVEVPVSEEQVSTEAPAVEDAAPEESPAAMVAGTTSPDSEPSAPVEEPTEDAEETFAEVEPITEELAVAIEESPSAVATITEEPTERSAPSPEDNGGENGRVAATVSARPVVPPTGTPEGVRTQRLLTVVKARAIQDVKTEPQDKVNTWPHLMLMEFGALLAITGLLVIMAVVIHSPLLDPANFNATPNPSKAPWYFLGLQELLSYFDPQIAGVMVPTVVGLVGFMAIPFVDKNPSIRPSDRKFAILLYSIFMAGAATLTIIGVLFRGRGFNFSYPWKDGIFFDDLKDWVQFE
jgi:menaquinol-cytochrome c reductase cytochrome b/c subunit